MSAPAVERVSAAPPPQQPPGTQVPRALTVPGILAPSLATWAAVLLSALSLGPLFDESGWFGATLLAVTVVVAVGGIATWLRAPMVLVPVLCAAGLFSALVLRFVDDAPWGFVPTPDALGALRDVLAEGSADINRFAPPVPYSEGLAAITALGVGSVALVVVVLQVVLRLPAIAGLPLVAMYVVPAAVLSEGAPWWAFVAVVSGWLLLLVTDERLSLITWGRVLRRSDKVGGAAALSGLASSAFRLGAVAIAVALVLPIVIPGLADAVLGRKVVGTGGEGSGGTGEAPDEIGIDPLVSLRRDLLEQPDVTVLTYSTTDPSPSYLRTVVLTDFDGDSWKARGYSVDAGRPIEDGVDSVAGISPTVKREDWRYELAADALVSRFLPLPEYVTALSVDGPWYVEDATDVVFGADEDITTRDARWDVDVSELDPTPDQLRGATPLTGKDRADVAASMPIPDSVRQTAAQVVGTADTDYDMAMALQSWFRSEFTYSTQVRSDSSGDFLEQFLRDRVGYCEQFSASMALMATSLGIPSRVVVGFTPGTPVSGQDDTYRVSAENAHAWPELFFSGVGWVKFEPTPGTATNGPALPPPAYADPEAQPSEEPTPDSTGATAPGGNPRDQDLAGDTETDVLAVDAGGVGSLLAGDAWRTTLFVGLLALLAVASLVPAGLRWVRRRRRLSSGAGVEDAWSELRDTAIDLGVPWSDASTPRQAVAALVADQHLTGEAAEAAARIGRVVERARYAPTPPDTGWLAADVAEVRKALLHRRDRSSRLRASFAPRSLRPA